MENMMENIYADEEYIGQKKVKLIFQHIFLKQWLKAIQTNL